MKTIFITSFHPLISRNILATPIRDRLLARGDVRVVLLVPDQKRSFFEDVFRHPRLTVEGASRRLTRRDAFLRYLALSAFNTRSLAIKRRTELGGSGTWSARLAGNRRWFRDALRRLDRRLTPRNPFDALISRRRPALIFSTDIQNEFDVRLVHAARDRGIPVVGMVRSWDNLTAKGLIRAVPEVLVVNNELVKREAMELHGIPASKIRVVGIPHYDWYVTERCASREEFFRRIGAEPQKRLILFAPTGDRYLRENTVDREVLELLRDAAPADCQILVRLPPTDTVNLDGLRVDRRVIIERPATHGFSPRNTELTRELDRHLADTMAHADLLVSGPSTMAVDAAVFDLPVILTAFYGTHHRPYHESVRRYFDYDHQQPLLASGGAWLARSPEEFRAAVTRYLADRACDREGRVRIVREQCWRADGQSSQRLLAVLSAYL